MRSREIALLGLLSSSACGFPNRNFILLTEGSSDSASSSSGDAPATATTADATTDRPTTSDPSTTHGDTDGVTGTSVPTGTTVGPTSDATTVDPGTDSTTTVDPSTGETGDTTTGDGPVLPDCLPQDPSLRACYDFEYEQGVTPTKLIDGSMYDHNGGVMNAELVPGIEGTGLRIADTTKIGAPTDNNFAWPSQAITMTAWIRPAALPAGGNYVGVLHKGPEFGLGIAGGVGLVCRVGAGTMESMMTPPAVVWSHVACVYDNGSMTLYLNGMEVGSGMVNDIMLDTSPDPLLIGCGDKACGPMNRFAGDVDNVRLWSAALKPNLLCAEAGNPNCL